MELYEHQLKDLIKAYRLIRNFNKEVGIPSHSLYLYQVEDILRNFIRAYQINFEEEEK